MIWYSKMISRLSNIFCLYTIRPIQNMWCNVFIFILYCMYVCMYVYGVMDRGLKSEQAHKTETKGAVMETTSNPITESADFYNFNTRNPFFYDDALPTSPRKSLFVCLFVCFILSCSNLIWPTQKWNIELRIIFVI
jgi:hypothetical protein